MKKLSLILLCSLFIVNISCKKENNDSVDYPIELVFKSLDLGEGIITYIKDGEIESPDFSDDEMLYDIHEYQFAKSIIVKSNDSAKFVFGEGNPDCDNLCLDQINLFYKNMSIDHRNDSIIFRIAIDISYLMEYPSVGKLNEKLVFPGCISRYVESFGLGTNISSERIYGSKDFTSLINNLEDNDTLSIIKFSALYELK